MLRIWKWLLTWKCDTKPFYLVNEQALSEDITGATLSESGKDLQRWSVFVLHTKVLIGSVVSPTTKRPFITATSVLYESLINLVMWAMIQRSGTRLPPPLSSYSFSSSSSSSALILHDSVQHPPSLSLLSPCTEPAKQKLNYYWWVKEYDGSDLCVCVHASVHVNMYVVILAGIGIQGRKTCSKSRVTCFTPFYTLMVRNTHGLLNSQIAHVNFITALFVLAICFHLHPLVIKQHKGLMNSTWRDSEIFTRNNAMTLC